MKAPKDSPPQSPWASTVGERDAPKHDERVDFKFAVAFIVQQLALERTQSRGDRGNVSDRVGYARDQLHLELDADGRFLFGDLIVWGCTKEAWRSALLPFFPPRVGRAELNFQPLYACGGGRAVPSTPHEKDEALRDAHLKMREMELTIAAQVEALARLGPLEIKRQLRKLQARADGKRGGRPKKG